MAPNEIESKNIELRAEVERLRADRRHLSHALGDLLLEYATTAEAERSSTWEDIQAVPEVRAALYFLGWPSQAGLKQSRTEREDAEPAGTGGISRGLSDQEVDPVCSSARAAP